MYLVLFGTAVIFYYLLGLKNVSQIVTTGQYKAVERHYRTIDFVNIPE